MVITFGVSTRSDRYKTVIERLSSLEYLQDRTILRRLRSNHSMVPVIAQMMNTQDFSDHQSSHDLSHRTMGRSDPQA